MTSTLPDTSTINEHEAEQVERANTSGLTPVVFVHGLWLLPNSWDRWVTVFEEAGFAAVSPGWPDDPETVEEAKAHPEVFAHKSIGQVADYQEAVIRRLQKKPAVVGHALGGLLAQIPAGRGIAAVGGGADADNRRGQGSHRAAGDREGLLQPAEAKRGGHRVRGDPGPRARAHHRQRLARGRGHRARLRPALRLSRRRLERP